MTGEELAAKLRLDARALELHLGALSSVGLLERRDGKWSATASARTWLHPDAEGYWGGFLFRYRGSDPTHGQLLATLKTGDRPDKRPLGAAEWEKGTMSQEMAERIAKFMHSHSIAPAHGAARQSVFADVTRLMDVGCGSTESRSPAPIRACR